GGAGSLAAFGGCGAGQPAARPGSAAAFAARSGEAARPPDATSDRTTRCGDGGCDGTASANHRRAGAEPSRDAALRSAQAACERGDQTAGRCRPGTPAARPDA